MQDRLPQLRWAIRIHAPMVRLALGAHHLAAAHRALRWHVEPLMPAGVGIIIYNPYNLRDHIAAAFHFHPIADLHAEPLDLIHVVKSGTAHSRPADWHGF